MEINRLRELVGAYLQKRGKRFLSYTADYFLPPGENYGSLMLLVNIKVKDAADEKEEVVQCVAKMLPQSQTLRDYFNTSVTFKKEIVHYESVVPLLDSFAKDAGSENFVDFSAECLGTRISLDAESTAVDDDAVFLLENLKPKGYVVEDRFVGFDLAASKLILKNLAKMHAAGLAFKLARPDEFRAKILPNLGEAIVFVIPDDILDNLVECVQKYASRNPRCLPLMGRIAEGTRRMKDLFVYSKVREPFATIVHTDLWTNNILIKYHDGKPVSNVFIDFPLCQYNSPVRDVIFFVYSSVRLDVLKTSVDELFKFYYDSLVGALKTLKCNDAHKFTYQLFLEEIDVLARETEFCHCVFMCTPIYTAKGEIKDMKDWRPEHLAPENEESLHPNYHEKLQTIILDFAARGWI